MRVRLVVVLICFACFASTGGQYANASGGPSPPTASDPPENLDRFRTPAEIYDFIAGLVASDPAAAARTLDLMLWQPDRHKRRTSVKEFLNTHRAEALRLFDSLDSRVLAGFLLRDTVNSTPKDTIVALMISDPEKSADLLALPTAQLVSREWDDKYDLLKEVQKALLWSVAEAKEDSVVERLYAAFQAKLGRETFTRFVEEGWSLVQYELGSPVQRATLEKALVHVGLQAKAYEPRLLDDSNPGLTLLTQARKTRQSLGRESPWSLYLYSSTDTDLEWWDGYRQVTNLERIGSDPSSLQIVSLIDPYGSSGEIRDRITVGVGRTTGKPRGATSATRTYYVEHAPYTVVGENGNIYSLDTAKPIQAWASNGDTVEVTVDQLVRSAFDQSPGGYPIVDKEALLPLEWDTLVAQNPELKGKDDEYSQMITSPVLDSYERNTGDWSALVRFWETARRSAPARRTMLAVLSHGAGISGLAWDYRAGPDHIDATRLIQALDKMTDGGRRKIDVLFLQACSMLDVELIAKLAPYANWIVGFEPGSVAGQSSLDLIAWTIKNQPDITPEQVARMVASSRPPPSDVLAAAIDTERIGSLDTAVSSFALALTSAVRDGRLAQGIAEARLETPTASEADRIDLVAFADYVRRDLEKVLDAELGEEAAALKRDVLTRASELTGAARLATPQINVDRTLRQGLNGLCIWFPLEGKDWGGTEWLSGNSYFSDLADPAWARFIEAITPFVSATMVYGPEGRLTPGDGPVWKFIDEVTLRPVDESLVRLGELREGVYELAVPAGTVLGYSGEQGGGGSVITPDRDGKYRVWVKGFLRGRSRPGEILPVRLIAPDGRRVFAQGEVQYHSLAVYAAR